ncbi:symporter [candidate division LCP-89 bacterium B3_LCP]|uniref:Sodium/proline symporter n=1 Tax=candidate division LCP-89 bacterium B3_LCP TaxID=2012998 RepID=A0A532UUB6_UNCL8|nr:MAG: symporter [candidate division LCP-89 bacterium B3_LCP]
MESSAPKLILIIYIIYLAVLLTVGFLTRRRTKTVADYFLGGRKIGPWLTAVSSTASSESGWVVLGATGMVYANGLSAWWFMPGCLAGYLVNWLFLAGKMRQHSEDNQSITVPDYISYSFGDRLNTLRSVAVLIIFFCMLGYVAAQFTASGKAFEAIFGWNYATGVLLGAVIIVIYTLMGGYFAVVWTDLIQGILMAFGLVVMPIVAFFAVGGADVVLNAAPNPEFFTWAGGKTGSALFGLIVGLLGIGLGYPGQPHVITRYMGAASDEVIRRGRIISIVWGVLVFGGAVLLGLVGRALIPNLEDSEHLFPRAALLLLHPIVAGIMLSAILSAIMSTASSQLLVAASSVVKDLYESLFGKDPGEKKLVNLSRIAVLLLGTLAILLALAEVRVIFWFVLFAWSGMGAAFGPIMLLSVSKFKVNFWGALSCMITGFGVTVIWKLTGLSDSVIYELVPAFVLAFLAAWGVTVVTRGGMLNDTN